MTILKSLASNLLSIALVAIFLPATVGSPYVINDDRVRSLDITPVLGRGYSIMTNSFQSTCLDVKDTTTPSYNYDYSFYEYTKSTDYVGDMSSDVSGSFGWWWVRVNVNAKSSSNTKVETKSHYIIATMRIERYYSSVREEVSELSAPAAQLLQNQDYVGFFKACGPNYVRGIRRAQEVFAVFNFQSSSTETASSYAANVQVAVGWWWRANRSFERDTKFSSISSTLKITILGYGLGLNQEGSETLVARNLMEFHAVMDFAFITMTQNKDSHHIGMVYGMEVVPWVESVPFQIEAGLNDEIIEIPQPRSVIPKAYRRSDPTDKNFNNNQRDAFRCKEPAYEMDKYGYCCEEDQLYDFTEQEYVSDDPQLRICRPLRVLDKAIISENMAQNGEFVARLDRAVRYKMNQLNTVEKCVSAARSIPERYDFNYLKPQDTVKYDSAIDLDFAVIQLKLALDPFNDYSVITHMATELDEFMEMYYQPCIAALFGTKIGRSSDTDPSYFMAYPWHHHDECTHLSCLATSMRWDRRTGGGCIPSLISGHNSESYDESDDSACKKDSDSPDDRCKYDSSALRQFHQGVTNTWEKTVPLGRIDYFMEHFCMPNLTDRKMSPLEEWTFKKAYFSDVLVEPYNVAKNKPTEQSSTAYGGQSSRGVDGNRNTRYRYNGITHTDRESNAWWSVDLTEAFEIQKIVVINRTDCCSDRLRGFKVEIYWNGRVVETRTHPNTTPEKVTEFDFSSTTVVGDMVKISLQRTDYLSLAEVKVIGSP